MMLLLLAAGIFLQQASKTFIVLNYELDKKYIATVLCENKNRPSMHCNGKCHLHKQLNKDSEQQGSTKQTEKQENICWESASAALINFDQYGKEANETPGLHPAVYNVSLHALFHPPCD